jgi:hypothetical protein
MSCGTETLRSNVYLNKNVKFLSGEIMISEIVKLSPILSEWVMKVCMCQIMYRLSISGTKHRAARF